MTDSGALKVTTPTEREIVMTRVFDAPRRLVFEAFTQPELLKRWLLGPDGWSLAEAWYPGAAVGTLVLVEQGGKTTVTQTMRYESRAARDTALKTGMEKGVAASYDRLEGLLGSSQVSS